MATKAKKTSKRRTEAKATGSTLSKALTYLLNYKDDVPKKRAPFTREERSAGSVLPMGGYVAPKGWKMQSAQLAGRPAVAVYRDGKLKRVRYITGDGEHVAEATRDGLPSTLKWQGTRANFRVLGQVRRGVFEALAVVMLDEPTIISNLTDSVATTALHHGFTTPTLSGRMKPNSKLTPVTVLTSTYAEEVRIVWFNRVSGKVIKKTKFSRL